MKRIESVDIFRLIAIIAVISIHTSPFRVDSPIGNEIYSYLDIIINQLARFSVPFFFVISGYFWGIKIIRGDSEILSTLHAGKRILILFFAWSFIYLLPYNLATFFDYGVLGSLKASYWHISKLMSNPLKLLMEGTKVHLWFMIGLLFSFGICSFFIYKKWIKSLIILSVLLYIFGILAKAYVNTPFGINIEFNTRNGPFFGTIFFVSGYMLSKFSTNTKWLNYGVLIFIIGCIIHFSEIYILFKVFSTSPYQDFVFGTYFMGLGVAVASLSNHPILRSHILSKIGQMTLGIYAVHYIYIDIFNILDKKFDSPIWEISYVFLVLTFSIATSIALSKIKLTRKIVV